jgi:hypothetical protein
MGLINESLKHCVEVIRKDKFFTLDKINAALITSLYDIEGVDYFEDLPRDQIVFSLPITKLNCNISYPKDITLVELVNQINFDSKLDLRESFAQVVSQFGKIAFKCDFNRLLAWFDHSFVNKKPRVRTTLRFNTGDKISLNFVKNLYIISHYNPAELSMLKDFDLVKKELNIVNKSFVTLGKPHKIEGSFVYFRDTHLLTPAGGKSLDALGRLYESQLGFKKQKIDREDLEDMEEFLRKDRKRFEEYAMIDAIITLTHAITLDNVNFGIRRLGVPITLSSLGRNLVFANWSDNQKKYFPYQVSGDVLIGNADEVQTPKGLFATGDLGLNMSYYIGNYKGGRNESFMYGAEDNTT